MCNDDKIIADFGAEDYNNWCIEKLKEDYNELKENNEKIKEDYNEIKELENNK